MSERERIRRIRRIVVRRLAELERERDRLLREGHPRKARELLRTFQELARVLETIDEVRKS